MRLRTINRWLRPCGWVLIIQEFDEPEATERGRTALLLHWIGLRWSRRRKAWDAKWMVDVPHLPELAATEDEQDIAFEQVEELQATVVHMQARLDAVCAEHGHTTGVLPVGGACCRCGGVQDEGRDA